MPRARASGSIHDCQIAAQWPSDLFKPHLSDDVTASQGDAKGCWSQRGQRAARVQLQSRALYERTIDLGQVAACASLVRILCRCWYHQLEGLVEDHVPSVGL